MTQRPGGSDLYSQAYQSPNLEFICFQAFEWVGGTQYADIVLPVSYVQENEDLIAWHNYVIYNAPAIPNMFESKSDMQIVYDLANKLGVMSKLAPGRSGDYQTDLQYWLANGFANISPAVSNAINAQPTTFAAFKQVGYLQFPAPDVAATTGTLATFQHQSCSESIEHSERPNRDLLVSRSRDSGEQAIQSQPQSHTTYLLQRTDWQH